MATTALKKITTRAKQIRKAKPNIQWKDAVKAASKEYKKPAAKKAAVKKPAKKVFSGVKKTAVKKAVPGAVNPIAKYAELSRILTAADNYLEYLKRKLREAPKTEKAFYRSRILQQRKTIAVVKQQKALQKKLI